MFGIVLGAYWLFVVRVDQAESAALRKRLKTDITPVARKDFRILKPAEKLSGVVTLNSILAQMGRITDPLQRDLSQAGMKMNVSTLLLSSGVLGLAIFLVVSYITLNRMFGLAAGVVAASIPFFVVRQ